MADLPRLRIFLSSPGDVQEERATAEIVFRNLAHHFREAVQLDLVIWEHEPVFAHTNFQQQIPRPSQCDLVVTILWSRLGTRLPDDFKLEGSELNPTGTEFEVRDALASFKAMGKPNLLIYRRIPPPKFAPDGADFEERVEQYRNLDRFCKEAFYDQKGRVIVAHTTFPDRETFKSRLTEHVREWLLREIQALHGKSIQLSAWRGSSPFRGLLPFEAEHEGVYFGREAALSELLKRVQARESTSSAPAPRLLLVQGMSGSGKTSLINAGLRPLLELRPVEGIAQWSIISIRPSDSIADLPDHRAFGALAAAILKALNAAAMPIAKLADLLRSRPEVAAAHIDEWIVAAAPRDGNRRLTSRLVLYIDQLEEAFLPSVSTDDCTALFALVVALSQADSIWVIATLRSDFAYRLESIPALGKCLEGNARYTLLPPGPGELVDIIRQPAQEAGLLWEERDGVTLDKALLNDTIGNPESLPLLEYTLDELYEKRDGRYLRWSAYAGSLAAALVSAADEVVAAINDPHAFRDVMRELVSVQSDGTETRRYARMARFPPQSKARELVTRLIQRRLCVADEKGGEGPVAYLAHEALIRAWPEARKWLANESRVLRLRDELARDVAAWERHGRSTGYLATAPEKLAVLREVESTGLLAGDAEEAFASQSRERARRNRLVRQAAVTGICALTVIALYEWRIALNEKAAAERSADTAHHATEFMVSLFRVADPESTQGNSVKASEVLRRGADEINAAGARGLQTDPAVRAELLTAMGQSFTGLGLYSDAQRLLAEASDTESKAAVPQEVLIRTELAVGTVLSKQSKFDAAQEPLKKAATLAESLPPSDILRSEAFVGYADNLSELDHTKEADGYLQRALTEDRARVARNPQAQEALGVLAGTLDSTGDNYLGAGDFVKAEDFLKKAVELRTRVYGPLAALTGQSMNNLGAVYYTSGQYEKSLQEYEAVRPIYAKVYQIDSPVQCTPGSPPPISDPPHREVATLLSNIGGSELMLGQVANAERDLSESLKMTMDLEGEGHGDLVPPLNRLAMIEAYENKLPEAQERIERAAKIVSHSQHAHLRNQVLLTQGYLELLRGHLDSARALLEDSKAALESHRDQSDDYGWQAALWKAVDAQLIAAKGDVATAKKNLAEAREVLAKQFGAQSFYMLLVSRIAQTIDGTGQPPTRPAIVGAREYR